VWQYLKYSVVVVVVVVVAMVVMVIVMLSLCGASTVCNAVQMLSPPPYVMLRGTYRVVFSVR
jgi:hypothetical protein